MADWYKQQYHELKAAVAEHKTGHQHVSSRERELYEALSALVLYCRQKGVGGAAVERAKALLTGGR